MKISNVKLTLSKLSCYIRVCYIITVGLCLYVIRKLLLLSCPLSLLLTNGYATTLFKQKNSNEDQNVY